MKRITTFCLTICLAMFMIAFNFSGARFYSTAKMDGDFDYVKTVGQVAIHMPTWIWGYDSENNWFKVEQVPRDYPNIHISITNKIGDVTNENAMQYYIRILAQDGSTELPITYDVHTYDKAGDETQIKPLEAGVGYGPFTLSAGTESTEYYSLRANWTSKKQIHTTAPQNLKLQMVQKRLDGSLKTISETTFVMNYVGAPIEEKINTYLRFYNLDVEPKAFISQSAIEVSKGTTIDFANATQLASLGITIPETYYFVHATSTLTSWAASQTVTMPSDSTADQWIDVNLKKEVIITSVKAYIYDANYPGTVVATVDVPMPASKILEFTLSSVRGLHSSLASKTSILVGIKNGVDGYNIKELGNVNGNTITIDYNASYSGYSLKAGMFIYIGYWW